jgi:outer membrane protein assembly factor BamB
MTFPWPVSSAAALALLLFGTAGEAPAADWPQFLGSTRDGVYTGNDLAAQWPADGPAVLWKQKVGLGFSGPVVAGDRLILHHRLGDREQVDCLEAQSGKAFWRFEYAATYTDDYGFDTGPRATPAIAGERVFTFGAEGMLHCLDLASGKLVWSVDTAREFKSGKGFFGRACSPLVEGGSVILILGGAPGAGVVAFDVATGKVRWKSVEDEAGYSSPVAADFDGHRQIFCLARRGLHALDPATGQARFHFPFRPAINASVAAAVPLISGEFLFLSASYGAGAVTLRAGPNGVVKTWAEDNVLSSHYATSVHRAGFLYGFDGRQEEGCILRCVELKSGRIRWSRDGLKAGTVTLAGDQLLILTERGELIAANATPEAYRERSRAQILPFNTRAHPALANGRFYARSRDTLVCVDLRARKE